MNCGTLLLVLCLVGPRGAAAADDPFSFATPAAQARYDALTAELRCLVCQNQSLADSHADLAQDLRNEVYRMIESGSSDADIIEFLVARYGDFVLYRPPVKAATWLLWLGPFVLLTAGLTTVVAIARRRRRAAAPALLDPAERARLAALIEVERSGEA